jgi:GNAT superfamily N-acetyltransferase
MGLLERLPPRIAMSAQLVHRDIAPPLPIRVLTEDDIPSLAELLVAAYAGTVDDLGQTPAEALAELRDHTTGELIGPVLWDCSFVALDGETPAATVITCKEKGVPLLPYIYTHPDWQRRGLASALIQYAMNALLDRGYKQVRLRVALANLSARRLYEHFGFVQE